jgi:putative hemolysin
LDTTNSPAAWSNTMSFASPESDFCDGSQGRSFSTIAAASIASSSHNGSAWSNTMSFASPESDFCDSSHGQSFSTLAATTNRTAATLTNNAPAWSNTMTFASPESDFCDSSSILSATSTSSSEVLPKSRFVAHANQHVNTQWSHTLSFASPESDFCDGSRSLYSLLKTSSPFSMQPRTMAQAMASPLACVVTTKSHPHKIVCVNAAWEDLCGFKQAEVVNQTLSIIQGPQTNTELADKTVEAALQNSNNDSDRINDMYVVNYKKNGESFTNHVTISTMMLSPDQSDVEFLVGVLEPVEQSPLRCIA